MKLDVKLASALVALALSFTAMLALASCDSRLGESAQGQATSAEQGQTTSSEALDSREEVEVSDKASELTVLERERLKGADSFYQKLADGLDVNVLIVGDSISRGLGASRRDLRWANMLTESLQDTYGVDVALTNESLSGNTSYAGYVSTMALDDGTDYDLVIVCYGQNDDEYNFGLYYESILRAVKLRYPKASVLCILESCQRYYTWKIQVIQSLALHYGVPVVDVIAPFQPNYDKLTNDGVHPNDKGQEVYLETVKGVIDGLVAERHGFDPAIAIRQEEDSESTAWQEDVSDDGEWAESAADQDASEKDDSSDGEAEPSVQPVNNGVTVFDSFQWLPVERFVREGNTYTLHTTTQGVVLGIDFNFVPGYNNCQILVDGYTYATSEFWIDYDYMQRHIIIINEWLYGDPVDVQNEIQVVFGDDETGAQQADSFNGLALSG